MKQYWQKIVLRIDSLALRERAIVFALAVLVLITLVNTFMLDPQFAKQKVLSQQVKQDQVKIAEIRSQIEQKAKAQAADPDATNRELLKSLAQQSNQMHSALNALQKGLVSPDRMGELLEGILKRNTKLRLVSLTSLPVSGLMENLPTDTQAFSVSNTKAPINPPVASKDKGGSATPAMATVYKHGVEIVVQGSYLDMVNYMAELEAMPWQVFWAKAKLDAGEFSKATLSLTLYTLSLDKKWLNI